MINRAVALPAAHVERPFGRQQANAEPIPKPNEAKQPSDATNTSKLRQTKQTHTQQQRQPLAEERKASRNREKHKQNKWEAQAGTRRNTSRNNEERKEKAQAETRRSIRKTRGIHKQKQRNTLAESYGNTSRSRGKRKQE